MYLARKCIKGLTHYSLRESYTEDGRWKSRELAALGPDPARYIVYPGGNAFYLDDVLTEAIAPCGSAVDPDALEDLFWPFVRPDIRCKVEQFRNRGRSHLGRQKLTAAEKEDLRRKINTFDKRRAHFLKFGQMDQGPAVHLPVTVFRHLVAKSRDEIEQLFIQQEQILKAHEYKTYVYVSFDLQRFFPNFMALKMPQALDQPRVDQHFLEEICRLNQDLDFEFGGRDSDCLHEYLVRYLIMFFDHDYAHSPLLDDFVKDFIFRHRRIRRPEPRQTVSLDDASTIFGIKKEVLKAMSQRGLTSLYRRLAQQHHPDKGGDQEKFIRLQDAYEDWSKRLVKD